MRHAFENPRNGCAACGQDFAGLTYFDKHRVGTFEYSLTEGLRLDPPREDGRRCLTRDEMLELGLALDKSGRWTDPAEAARLRAAHNADSRSGETPVSASQPKLRVNPTPELSGAQRENPPAGG